MKSLGIDIETYSDIDIKQGVYRYVDSPTFEILLFAYAYDDEEVEIVDFTCGESLPDQVLKDLENPTVIKRAFNAQFERVCIGKYLGKQLDPSQWWCTKVHAAYLGLPASLEDVATFLGLEEQKDTAGTLLINYFCKPCKPSKANGGRTRNYSFHAMDRWELFVKYCMQDVRTERAIEKALSKFEIPEIERRVWTLDQVMNDFGAGIDLGMVEPIIRYNDKRQDQLLEKANAVTGLENSNSNSQLIGWLRSIGVDANSVAKDNVEELLADEELPLEAREVLELRKEMSKSSIKKYYTMRDATCSDGRIRGVLQYYGANRTGRWAGRLVQVQNLPRNYMKELDSVRKLVKTGDFGAIEMLYDSPSDTLSQLIRTAFVPTEGCKFVISDYSAIEARVIAWLSGEEWVNQVFAGDGKIYEATAAQMFNVPIEKVDKELRQKGKVATLALGYQGGVNALIAMGALNMNIPESELPGIVHLWRKANKRIVRFWSDVEEYAMHTVETGRTSQLRNLKFEYIDGYLLITLPSGRRIAYANARLEEEKGQTKIVYAGVDSGKFSNKLYTYGGKLVENIVQATARDCLAHCLLRLEEEGYRTVFHVHDEAILEVPAERVEEDFIRIKEIMDEPIPWAEGLILKCAGFTADYYMKD